MTDGGEVKGLAFALNQRYAITCAHVVNVVLRERNGAQGRDIRESSEPGRTRVRMEFRSQEGQPDQPFPTYGYVEVWRPGLAARWLAARDVVVLELIPPLPTTTARPTLVPGHRNCEVHMLGPSAEGDHDVVVPGRVLDEVDINLLLVDQDLNAIFSVQPGFSGGPVWRPGTGDVVGMLVAGGQGDDKRAVYAIAADELQAAVDELPPPAQPTPPPPPGRLVDLLHRAVAAVGSWLRNLGRRSWRRWLGLPALGPAALGTVIVFGIAATRVPVGSALLYGLRSALFFYLLGAAVGGLITLIARGAGGAPAG